MPQIVAVLLLLLLSGAAWGKSCKDIALKGLISQEQVWRDISTLADDRMQGRQAGKLGAQLARDYIAKRYREIGLLPVAHHPDYFHHFAPFNKKHKTGVNVLGLLPGKQSQHYIVVSAHYDHLGKAGSKIYNGADDNASGVAAMLALAQQMARVPRQHSLLFLATDFEERGLLGAKAFTRNPPVPLKAIKANLNLDMLAQGGSKNVLYIAGARKYDVLKPVVAQVVAEAGLCAKKGHEGTRKTRSSIYSINWRQASDHGAFLKEKIPYLYLGVDPHRYYHTPYDTVDKIHKPFYFAATETALLTLQLLDKAPLASAF